MKTWMWTVGLWMVGGAVLPASAQDRIYRCGNEYTNNPAQAKQNGCKLVEGGHLTVISADPAVRKPAPAVTAPPRPATGAPRVSADQQRSRDADARSILQAELSKAQEKLAALKAEYNDGNPQRSALELRNPQGYLERVDALKANIARQEGDIAGIQREITRLPGG